LLGKLFRAQTKFPVGTRRGEINPECSKINQSQKSSESEVDGLSAAFMPTRHVNE
jgi:hypothetical protein